MKKRFINIYYPEWGLLNRSASWLDSLKIFISLITIITCSAAVRKLWGLWHCSTVEGISLRKFVKNPLGGTIFLHWTLPPSVLISTTFFSHLVKSGVFWLLFKIFSCSVGRSHMKLSDEKTLFTVQLRESAMLSAITLYQLNLPQVFTWFYFYIYWKLLKKSAIIFIMCFTLKLKQVDFIICLAWSWVFFCSAFWQHPWIFVRFN